MFYSHQILFIYGLFYFYFYKILHSEENNYNKMKIV